MAFFGRQQKLSRLFLLENVHENFVMSSAFTWFLYLGASKKIEVPKWNMF